MTSTHRRRGRPRQHISGSPEASDPAWEPLVAQVGPYLAGWFEAAGVNRLEDGARLHAYRHRFTRRALHLHDDGTSYVAIGTDEFAEVVAVSAFHDAFGHWKSYCPLEEHDEFEAAYRAVSRALWNRSRPGGGPGGGTRALSGAA